MEKSTKEIAIKLLKEWAAAAVDKNKPTISMGKEYSAEDIVSEVENDTDFGRFFLDSIERIARDRHLSVERFLKENLRSRLVP
jgi:hypothetical protein